MNSIVLHPKTEQESRLYESIAQALKTPYTIEKARSKEYRQKPSDFIGTLSESTSMKLHEYVNKSRYGAFVQLDANNPQHSRL